MRQLRSQGRGTVGLLGWLGAVLLFLAGCGASVSPQILQEAIDEAGVQLQRAESAEAPALAPRPFSRAKALHETAVARQQQGDRWSGYYLARRAGALAELAAAQAEAERIAAQRKALEDRVISVREKIAEAQVRVAQLQAEIAQLREQAALERAQAAEAAAQQSAAAAKKAQQEADKPVAQARAELEQDKARLMLRLATEVGAQQYAASELAQAQQLLSQSEQQMEAGEFGPAQLTAADAFKAASDAYARALQNWTASQEQASQAAVDAARDAGVQVGQARAFVQVAEAAGAPTEAPQPFQKAQQLLADAEAALKQGDFATAQDRAKQAREQAVQAQAIAQRKRQLRRSQLQQEEQLAQLKDQLFRVRRQKEQLEAFARELSAAQLESVDGLLRQAEQLIQEGKTDLAAVIAARAESIVREAQQRAEQVQSAEAALLKAGRELEGVQAFVTRRGVVYRLSGDLFPVGRADLNRSAYPLVAQVAQAIRPFADQFPIVVEAHTDQSGNPQANRRLSEERAKTFANRLRESLGLQNVQIESRGYGDRQLLEGIPPDDPRNRRIEIVLLTRASE